MRLMEIVQSCLGKNIAIITTRNKRGYALHVHCCADIIKKYIEFRENDDDKCLKSAKDIEIVQKITKIIHC